MFTATDVLIGSIGGEKEGGKERLTESETESESERRFRDGVIRDGEGYGKWRKIQR